MIIVIMWIPDLTYIFYLCRKPTAYLDGDDYNDDLLDEEDDGSDR